MKMRSLLLFVGLMASSLSPTIAKSEPDVQSLPEVRSEFSIFSMTLEQEARTSEFDSPISGTNVAYRKEQLQDVVQHLQNLQTNPVTALYPGLGEAIAADLSDLQRNSTFSNQMATSPVTHVSQYVSAFINTRCHRDYVKRDKEPLVEIVKTVERGNYPALFCARHHFGYSNCQIHKKDKCGFLEQHRENKGDFVMFLDRS